MLTAVIPSNISDIKAIYEFNVQLQLSEVYPKVFIILRIIMTVPLISEFTKRSSSRLNVVKIYLRTYGTGILTRIAHSFDRE
jgi:hypothetical protein